MNLLTKDQAAELLNISVVSVDRLRKAGYLPFRKIGSFIRFLPVDIENFIQNSAAGGEKLKKKAADENT